MAATVTKKELTEKDGLKLRLALNGTARVFYYSDETEASIEESFKYLPHDVKLVRFAEGSVGVISDCFILYAVAMLGASTPEVICTFLRVLQKKYKELLVPDMTSPDAILRRLTALAGCGFVYKHRYKVPTTLYYYGEMTDITVALYSIADDGVNLVNQKLKKKVTTNQWFQAKPISELIGWGAASYVGVTFADLSGQMFRDFEQGVYRTRSAGTVLMPAAVKVDLKNKDHPGCVGFIPAFLHRSRDYQTDSDYEAFCYRFANNVSQYLYYCDSHKRYGRAVVVVQDNDDLVNAAFWIHKSGSLEGNLDRVFFTGESAFRGAKSLKEKFLMMRKDDSAEGGFVIVPANPDFAWLSRKK